MTYALIFLAGAVWGAILWHGITEPVNETRGDYADPRISVEAAHEARPRP